MPPPITTTSKCWPAISSIARPRLSIGGRLSRGRGGRGGAGRAGAGRSWRGLAEVEEADRALLGRQAERRRGPPLRAAGRACASSRRGRGRGRRAGRCRRRRRSRAGPPRPGPGRRSSAAGDDDQGRAAVELGGALRPGRLLQPRQRRRADDAEAPGHGEVVVRRPARQLQQLLQLLARQRLGAKALWVRRVRDRRLDVHRVEGIAPGAALRRRSASASSRGGRPSRGRRAGSRRAGRCRIGDRDAARAVVVVGVFGLGGAGSRCRIRPPRRVGEGPAPGSTPAGAGLPGGRIALPAPPPLPPMAPVLGTGDVRPAAAGAAPEDRRTLGGTAPCWSGLEPVAAPAVGRGRRVRSGGSAAGAAAIGNDFSVAAASTWAVAQTGGLVARLRVAVVAVGLLVGRRGSRRALLPARLEGGRVAAGGEDPLDRPGGRLGVDRKALPPSGKPPLVRWPLRR